jgi:hypothetical protein
MTFEKDIQRELEQRGTAEISSGGVSQVTQAIDEGENSVKFLCFGELREQKIKPIEETCAVCDFWKGKFNTVAECQESQKKDAEARGFHKLICPEQFIES